MKRSQFKFLERVFTIALAVTASNGLAADGDKPVVTFGGFIDTYYAYDFNKPTPADRSYGSPGTLASTANRHNEFNLGLVHLDGKLSADRLRGRLALQAGTSVQANYLGEVANSSVLAGSLVRHIQEATIGYRLGENLWLDAGIYFSHIGAESFISRDNWTYTRSLLAEFSPYYQTGVKLGYQASPAWGFQFHILNGWQNIYDNNRGKAVGTQVAYAPNAHWSFTYNTFFGQEVGTQWRLLNDWLAKYVVNDALQLSASFDLGLQRKPGVSRASTWYGLALLARYQLTPKVSVSWRVERYSDPDRVIVQPTDPAAAFVVNSASVNLDYELVKPLVWRNEARVYRGRDAVFPKAAGLDHGDFLIVTSLALSF